MQTRCGWTMTLLAATAALLSARCSRSGDTTAGVASACISQSQCATGTVCYLGRCIAANEVPSSGTGNQAEKCPCTGLQNCSGGPGYWQCSNFELGEKAVCLDDTDCSAQTPRCITGVCLVETCQNAQQCAAGTVCDAATSRCVLAPAKCASDADCPAGAMRHCDTATGACVQCLSSAQCASSALLCVANVCQQPATCTSDADCFATHACVEVSGVKQCVERSCATGDLVAGSRDDATAPETLVGSSQSAVICGSAGVWFALRQPPAAGETASRKLNARDGLVLRVTHDAQFPPVEVSVWARSGTDGVGGLTLVPLDGSNQISGDSTLGVAVLPPTDSAAAESDILLQFTARRPPPVSITFQAGVVAGGFCHNAADANESRVGGNNDAANAVSLGTSNPAQQYVETLTCGADQDWFKVELGVGARLQVVLTQQAGWPLPNMMVSRLVPGSNALETIISLLAQDSQVTRTTDALAKAGTYYLQFSDSLAKKSRAAVELKTLCPEDGYDNATANNDDYINATAVLSGQTITPVACAGDSDWFRLDGVTGKKLKVLLTAVDGWTAPAVYVLAGNVSGPPSDVAAVAEGTWRSNSVEYSLQSSRPHYIQFSSIEPARVSAYVVIE